MAATEAPWLLLALVLRLFVMQTKAKFLPPQFQCAPKGGLVVPEAAPEPEPAPPCTDVLTNKTACKDTTGCVWCEASFSPAEPPKGKCYSEVRSCHLSMIGCRKMPSVYVV